MEQEASLVDMAASYRGAYISHLVLDTGRAQTFTRDISLPTVGGPANKRLCDLDCGAPGFDYSVSESQTAVAEITISPGGDLGCFGGCHRVGFNVCYQQQSV
jgi:hypothetical protein